MYSYGRQIAENRRQKTGVIGIRRAGLTGLPGSYSQVVVTNSVPKPASVIGGRLDELDEDAAGILGMDEVDP